MVFAEAWGSKLDRISFIMKLFVFPGVSTCFCSFFTLGLYNSPILGERLLLFVICLLFKGLPHFLCCSQRPPFWGFLVSWFCLGWPWIIRPWIIWAFIQYTWPVGWKEVNWHHEVMWKLLSYVQLFGTPWTIQSMEFSRPEYWSG